MRSALHHDNTRVLRWEPAPGGDGAVLRFPAPNRAVPSFNTLSESDRLRLSALRQIARESSLACRPACILACDKPASRGGGCADLCAAEQFRAFLEVGDRRITLYRPGAEAVSEDEQWLLKLTAALIEDDVAGAAALIAFRIARPNRRQALARALTVTRCLSSFLDRTPDCAN